MASQNAAFALWDMFETFSVPAQQAPETSRGFETAADLRAWRNHTQGLALVRLLDEALTAMEREGVPVDSFQESLPFWYAGAAFGTTPWGSVAGARRPVVAPEHMAMLKALGALMMSRPHVELTEEDSRTLAEALDEAATLIDEDEGLPPEAKAYLFGLIDRAQWLLSHAQDFGPEAVREVALQLGGALYVRAEAEDEGSPRRAKFKKAGEAITMTVMRASVTEGVRAVGGTVKRALESGLS